MKLMGMKGWIYWASWYFKFSLIMLVTVLIITFVCHFKSALLKHGDPSVTFVFLLLYGISLMAFCFAVSTFFSTGLMIMYVQRRTMAWSAPSANRGSHKDGTPRARECRIPARGFLACAWTVFENTRVLKSNTLKQVYIF